jgi:hypothetical protein
MPSDAKSLKRPIREPNQVTMFDMEPNWREHWWGMPEFSMGDATPQYRITINFMTAEDVKAFAEATGLSVTTRSDSAWFPPQNLDEPKEWAYVED